MEQNAKRERAVIAGIYTGLSGELARSDEKSFSELKGLIETSGGETIAEFLQPRPAPDVKTFVGEGKIEEIAAAAGELSADLLVFDDELSPSQIQNISDIMGIKVIDRPMLILDIFAKHAVTSEGKIQVELAQLGYMFPRLYGQGKVLSRLGGGIGTRGPGETKLEIDRRHVRSRMAALRADLSEIKKNRAAQRKQRERSNLPKAAIIGYTNAGKSTLLNYLTNAGVLAENKLFATLDTTTRSLVISEDCEVLLTDTVGFIRRLPHHLIEAFKSTLEEVTFNDLLIHVVDASDPEYRSHIATVEKTVSELGAGDKKVLYAFNKCDLLESVPEFSSKSDHVAISAATGEGVDALLLKIKEMVAPKKFRIKILVPFSEGRYLNEIREGKAEILSETYVETGTELTILADEILKGRLKRFLRE